MALRQLKTSRLIEHQIPLTSLGYGIVYYLAWVYCLHKSVHIVTGWDSNPRRRTYKQNGNIAICCSLRVPIKLNILRYFHRLVSRLSNPSSLYHKARTPSTECRWCLLASIANLGLEHYRVVVNSLLDKPIISTNKF